MLHEPIPDLLLRYLPLARNILIAAVILLIGWRLSHLSQRMALRLLSNRHVDQALGRFFASILRYLVLAATVITSMESVGLHTTSLVAILASAGLAVALAMQGSLSNFASGVMVLFFRPFELGDKVKIVDNVGVVDDIGVFTTTLISASNEKIIIPNSKVTENPILNFSNRGNLKGTLTIELDPDADMGLYARTDCVDGASQLGCADVNFMAGMQEETLVIPVTADVPVTIFVDAYQSDGGPFSITLSQ